MSPGAGLLFALALAAAAATPGPSTATAAARVLTRGLGGAMRLCVGLVLGELFWLLCAILGAGGLADRHPGLFAAIRYAGVAYLLFLAWKLWRARPVAAVAGDRNNEERLLFAGLVVALGNPKTMLFYVALLPGIVSLEQLSLRDALILAALATAVVGGILAAYVLSAERFRRHHPSPVASHRIRRGSALLMAVAAAATASR